MYVLDKYSCRKLSECMHKSAVSAIEEWYKRGHKKPLLIYGKTGVGKSTLVQLFAKQNNLFVFELGPSDDKNRKTIETIVNTVSQTRSIFSDANLLFFDDIDVFIDDDRGGFDAILSAAKESRNPVIFAATNIYADKRLMALREACEQIQLKALSFTSIFSMLHEICVANKVRFDKDALLEIAKLCDGDLRAAVLDIDFLAPFGITKETVAWLSGRERKADVFKTVLGLFSAKTFAKSKEISDKTEIDYDLLFAWIVENLPLFYGGTSLKEAYKYLSLADINKSRIYVRQNWVFFRYFIVLGIIAPTLIPHKDHFTFKISYPSAIKMRAKDLSAHSKNKKVAQILTKILRGSISKIVNELFYYKFFFEGGGFANYLKEHLTDEELKFLGDFFKVDLSGAEEKRKEVAPEKKKEEIEITKKTAEKEIEKIVEKELAEKEKKGGAKEKKKEKADKEKKETEKKQKKLF